MYFISVDFFFYIYYFCLPGGHTLVLLAGLFSGELPECTQELMIDVTKSYYQKFLPLTQV